MNFDEKEIKAALANWPEIIAKYHHSSNAKAIMQICNSYLPFVALWVLMYFSLQYSIWLTILLAMVNAFFLVRIFIIQHDCGHHSFFKRRSYNKIVGWISSFFSTIPFSYWARVHSFHHGHAGQLEHRDIGDIDMLTVEEYRKLSRWKRFKYRLFRHPVVLFVIVPIIYLGVMIRLPKISFPGWKKVHFKQFINNALLLILYLALGYFIGWKQFFFIQGSILFFFGIIAFWFFYVQHQHEYTYMQWTKNWNYLMASIRGATYYKLPGLFTWLTGNIGFHHIHHLSSRIPNYNLRKCVVENPILQKYVTIVTFRESLPMMFNKLWDEHAQRMISFREFYRRERMMA